MSRLEALPNELLEEIALYLAAHDSLERVVLTLAGNESAYKPGPVEDLILAEASSARKGKGKGRHHTEPKAENSAELAVGIGFAGLDQHATNTKLAYLSLKHPGLKCRGLNGQHLLRLRLTSRRMYRAGVFQLHQIPARPHNFTRLVHTLVSDRYYCERVQQVALGDWLRIGSLTAAEVVACNAAFEKYDVVTDTGTPVQVWENIAGGYFNPLTTTVRPTLGVLALCCAERLRCLKLTTFASPWPIAVRAPTFAQLTSIWFCNSTPDQANTAFVSSAYVEGYASLATYQWILGAAPNLKVVCASQKRGLESLASASVSTLVMHNCHVTTDNMNAILVDFPALTAITYHSSSWNRFSSLITPELLVDSLNRNGTRLKYMHGDVSSRYLNSSHYARLDAETFKLDYAMGDPEDDEGMTEAFLSSLPTKCSTLVLGYQPFVYKYLPALAEHLVGSAVSEVIITVRAPLDEARRELSYLYHVCPDVRWRLYMEPSIEPYWVGAERATKHPGASPWA